MAMDKRPKFSFLPFHVQTLFIFFLAILILNVECDQNHHSKNEKSRHPHRHPRSISSMVAGMVYSAIANTNTQPTSVATTNLVQSGNGVAQYAAPHYTPLYHHLQPQQPPYQQQHQQQQQLAQSSDAIIDAIWNSNPDYRFTAGNQLVVGNGVGAPNLNYASPYQNQQQQSVQTAPQPLIATPLQSQSVEGKNGSSFDGYQLLTMGRDLVMDNLGLYMTALQRSMHRRKQKPIPKSSKRRPKPRPGHVEYFEYSYEDDPEFEYY